VPVQAVAVALVLAALEGEQVQALVEQAEGRPVPEGRAMGAPVVQALAWARQTKPEKWAAP
jgi:hypothetical protein